MAEAISVPHFGAIGHDREHPQLVFKLNRMIDELTTTRGMPFHYRIDVP